MENRQEDMHHAVAQENLDLASGSPLSLAIKSAWIKTE